MKTCFRNFNLIDGNGGDIINNATMVVENGKIVGFDDSSNNVAIDLKGRYVLPGLMDAHIHMTASTLTKGKRLTDYDVAEHAMACIQNLELCLKQGVTFVRDVGSFDKIPVELSYRKYLKNGSLKGCKMICSGNIVTMTSGHAAGQSTKVCDGVEGVRKATRELISEGVDLIKTVATGGVSTEGNDPNAYQFNLEELQTIVLEAHKAGRKVAVHAHGAKGIKNAIQAGVDSIEHGTLIDDEGIQMMLKHGTWLVPTFTVGKYILESDIGLPEYMKEKESQIIGKHHENIKKAFEAGVKLGCGTDITPPYMPFHIAEEIALMIESTGMSAMEAILCATKNNSELMGVDDEYGTLEIGKYADFIVLESNPIEDISKLKHPVAVYQSGILVV